MFRVRFLISDMYVLSHRMKIDDCKNIKNNKNGFVLIVEITELKPFQFMFGLLLCAQVLCNLLLSVMTKFGKTCQDNK